MVFERFSRKQLLSSIQIELHDLCSTFYFIVTVFQLGTKIQTLVHYRCFIPEQLAVPKHIAGTPTSISVPCRLNRDVWQPSVRFLFCNRLLITFICRFTISVRVLKS